MGDEQQQAEWHPHLGSLVRAGARGSWHPGGASGESRGGLLARRQPDGGTAGAGAAPGSPDPPSAQGSAARSSEGVGGARTLPRRGGAPAGRRVNPLWAVRAVGGGAEGVVRPRARWPDCPAVPRPASFPPTTWSYSRVYWEPDAGTHTRTRPVTPIPPFSTPPATPLPPLIFYSFLLRLPLFFFPSHVLLCCLFPRYPLEPNFPLADVPLTGAHCRCLHLAAVWCCLFSFLVPISLLSTCRVGCMP